MPKSKRYHRQTAQRTQKINQPALNQRIDLFTGLVDRSLKLLYNRSMLGIAWTLIKPLMQLIVFAIVFGSILEGGIPRYASFIFSGLIAWTWFQTSLTESAGSIVQNDVLIRQPGFPVAILPIVTVTTGLIHFLFSFPILILFLIIDGARLTPVLLLLPIILTIQAALITSFAYVLAAINVAFRDTQHTLNVLLQMLFYLSGIFYEVDSISEPYRTIVVLNPMVHIINAYRAVFIEGVQPDWMALGAIALLSAALLPIGYAIFQHQSFRFVEDL
ncbi:ABC transporter permease [cf. Phormidesmis sp. LEGE 11477]|uniref:ABC transporter permease n=1 Tax=cf. Phormidesmis sp. LEGE 11477 TaxID=1828680 RepID=UPI001880CEB4|nr:ABC transporter permease [cf. Phormidesmis sp. LEGE 11477]MBE9060370.1 ABC transporter permease [cf. Phormidesmis sp. LEGE 11477]